MKKGEAATIALFITVGVLLALALYGTYRQGITGGIHTEPDSASACPGGFIDPSDPGGVPGAPDTGQHPACPCNDPDIISDEIDPCLDQTSSQFFQCACNTETGNPNCCIITCSGDNAACLAGSTCPDNNACLGDPSPACCSPCCKPEIDCSGATCQVVDPNFAPFPPALEGCPSIPAQCVKCGDAEVQNPEECESNADCSGGEVCYGCQCVTQSEASCGNGLIDVGEVCDPLNQRDGCAVGEICSGDCLQCITCNNNNIQEGTEECDGTDDESCPAAGNPFPNNQRCKPDCTCKTFCGDGTEQTPNDEVPQINEKCDSGNGVRSEKGGCNFDTVDEANNPITVPGNCEDCICVGPICST